MNRPNILIITTDQQRFDTIQAGGNPYIRTPHLNWMLESGIHFTRCYSDSPICVPARATMLTGRHYMHMPPNVGFFGQVPTLEPQSTLPAVLTRHGYQTKSVGKLHYHPARTNYGWEDTQILEDYYRYMARHSQNGVPMDHGLGQNEVYPGISTVDESHSLTHWIVNESIDFLETRDTTRPFLLHVGFSKPHPPFDPCLNYWLQYQNATVPEPVYGDWSRKTSDIDPGLMWPTWSITGVDAFAPELIRDMRRAYYALITQVDYNLGLLFARVRELGLLSNTLILFTSDHGEMLGDHHMGSKTTFLEPSAHVPLLLRPPESPAFERYKGIRGTRCAQLTCLADIMSTCLAASECPAPDVPLDGIDLVAAARGEASRTRIFGRCGNDVGSYFYAVIEDRWKLIFQESGAELLFDLENDPMEQKELIRAGGYEVEHKRLASLLAQKIESCGWSGVKNGQLTACKKSLSREEIRRNPWPGFHHSQHTADDVLH